MTFDADSATLSQRLRESWQRIGLAERVLLVAALALALILTAPIFSVLLSLFETSGGSTGKLASTVLPRYAGNTLALMLLVGTGTLVLGTGTAWLVTMCRFPGRGLFEWALILPLAAPAYVLAYAYTDFLQHSGPLQSLLRDITGWGPRDYWFPQVRSLGGAAAMFVLVLYPYVYMLARNAFLEQSVCFFEASRTLGRTPVQAFWQVSLPLARPAIATGTALAIMETLADFGAVAHFGVQTFTTGIYRAWFSMGDRVAAGQLASALLGFVLLLILLERWQRGLAQFYSSRVYRTLPDFELTGWRGLGATFACALPVLFGFLVPTLILLDLALQGGQNVFSTRYLQIIWNTVLLAGLAGLVTLVLALLLAYAARLVPGRLTAFASRLASLGYAVPGSVIAVGILIPLTRFDNAIDGFMRASFGVSTGLLLTGSIAALIFGYAVRFMMAALSTLEASLARITPAMDAASRTLGETVLGTLRRVHVPLLRGGALTALLIVFVDVSKELPATLIMRPFNFDTLATQAYRLASDERLAQAATPSLVILLVGILPVILLSRQIMRSRPGPDKRGGSAPPETD